MSRFLFMAGAVLIALGVLAMGLAKLNLPFGRLPGDLVWKGKNSAFYFPWFTCLMLSLLGTLVLWLFRRR